MASFWACDSTSYSAIRSILLFFSVSLTYSRVAVLPDCGEEVKIWAWWELTPSCPPYRLSTAVPSHNLYLGKHFGLVICWEWHRWRHFQVFIDQNLQSPTDLLQGSTVWDILLWWLASGPRLTPLKTVGLFLVSLKEGQETKLNPIKCLGNTY